MIQYTETRVKRGPKQIENAKLFQFRLGLKVIVLLLQLCLTSMRKFEVKCNTFHWYSHSHHWCTEAPPPPPGHLHEGASNSIYENSKNWSLKSAPLPKKKTASRPFNEISYSKNYRAKTLDSNSHSIVQVKFDF